MAEMKTVTLAELLLLRKELKEKRAELDPISKKDLYEVKLQRQRSEDGIDNIIAQVPKIAFQQLVAARDDLSRKERIVNGLIQKYNHSTEVEVPAEVFESFKDPYIIVTRV